MSDLTCCLLFICLFLPAQAAETESDNYIHQIRTLSKQKYQYLQNGKQHRASIMDNKQQEFILQSISTILRDLNKLSRQDQDNIISLIRKFPDKSYLQTIARLVRHADMANPLQRKFLEDIIFEPFEGPRDNFLAMNWRDQQIRNLCVSLKKKLPSDSPHQQTISSVLNGGLFRNMMYNALRNGDLSLPDRLDRTGYAPQFQQWGEQEQQQIAAIKELRAAWDTACSTLVAMKGKEDVFQTNQAWQNAAQKAKIVMALLPPDTAEGQQRMGKCFYDMAFSQYFHLSPAANAPGSNYQKMMKKLIELHETDEKLLSQLESFRNFQAEIINSTSYLNEEAVLLLKNELAEKLRKEISLPPADNNS